MSSSTCLQEWHITKPYLHLHCALGEGPFHEASTNSLRFVDIKKGRVHWVDLAAEPAESGVTTTQLDVPVGVTADIEGVDPAERILVGVKSGIAILDRKTGAYEYVARFPEPYERLRANDGAADPHGRFWLGSMSDIGFDLQDEGHLCLFDGTRDTGRSMRYPVTIPNALGWSPDKKTMYFTHSTEKIVYAWDYDLSSGALNNERVFYKHEGSGAPDGFRVDVEGNIWHAIYGESRVVKISPEGNLIGQVLLPTQNITCTQFVGTELFITTAAMENGEGPDEAVELSGALYKVDVGVKGLELFPFKLK
ncbi:hypothetical protein F5Y16DRAFT_145000 [Xylariaceae sp. FL0255]|nr:hypothetical protein F5Y16DRAFT_145000 [Xylariaceae sp. FL0255]